MEDYIVCPVCHKKCKRLRKHFVMAHKDMDFNELLKSYPTLKTVSDSERERYSKAQRKYCQTDKGRKQMVDMANKAWSSEEFRKNKSLATKKQWTEEFTSFMSKVSQETMLRLNRDEEFSKLASQNLHTWGKRIEYTTASGEKILLRSKLEYNIAKELDSLNILYNYESVRIPYVWEDLQHTYIVDFSLTGTNIVIEGKPESLWEDERVLAKYKAAQDAGYEIYLVGYDTSSLKKVIESATTIETITDKKPISENGVE